MLLILVILAGAVLQFKQVYFEPEFYALPPSYDYFQKKQSLDFAANTLAVALTAGKTGLTDT